MLVTLTQCEDSLTITATQNNDLSEVNLTSPEDGTEQTTTIEFDWSLLDQADSYVFQLSGNLDFSTVMIDSLMEENHFQIKGLPSDSTFYWQVRSIIDGVEGPWSATWQFSTKSTIADAEPLATDLTSPSDSTSTSPYSVAFSWTAIASASGYNIQVATDQEFSTLLVIDQEIKSSSYETTALSAEQTFYWRVEPVVSGEETQWSEVFQFATLAAGEISAPVQVSPDDGSTDVALQPTLEWEAVENADSYELHVSHDSQMDIETKVTDTTYSPSEALASGTTYYSRVRAVIGDTQGQWSEIHSFTTSSGETSDTNDSTVSLSSPSDGATGQSINLTLDWESVSGVNEYQVQLAQDNSFSSTVVDKAVSEASYAVSGLDYSQTYYWRAQANGDGDSGNWSTIYSFTTESETNVTNSVEGDRHALMDLYNATGGDSWANNSGWGSGDPSGSWHGVEVDANGRVVRLDLWKNGLQGQLPSTIGNLTKLTYLNVKGNKLTGRIPSEIGGMRSLEWL
ncbi:hypothetical protein CK503_14210, partial [Aliifodinibius salipaludis]